MTSRPLAVAALLVALAGCASFVPDVDEGPVGGPDCIALFRWLDTVENYEGIRGINMSVPPAIQRVGAWLRNQDCITYSRDLGGMAAALADPSTPRGDGTRYRSGALVHAGIVTSIRDDTRSLEYFEALGFHAYSYGTPGLGRRVFVGPVPTEEGAAGVIEAARRAGFRYPYVRRYGSSVFGGIVQAR